jgi:predicted heme/steroid binding protein/nitrogen fixation protein
MAKISTYPIVSIPTLNDLLIGTDVENLNETKNFSLADIQALIVGGNYVPYTGALQDVDLGSYGITANYFAVPGGLSTQFLKADGSIDSTSYQPAGNYITGLSGEASASGPGVANVTLNNGAVIGKVLTGLSVTGGSISSTDSILQAFGKLQNQVNSLYGGAIYQGTWDAATNNPALSSGVGTQGWYYIVNVAGSTNLDGITDWNVGDWAIFDGTAWQQVDNTDTVVSVNGQVGVVVLTTTNIAEGTNLYYLDSRARAAITLTTSGSSGASSYSSVTGILNVPNYTISGLGGVPSTRQLTINGTAYDLSVDRSWSVGTVTSVGTSAPLTGGTITGSGTIGITQAGISSNGYLSSTDWNTFNNKQNALTNPVTGTGTLYYIPMWTGTSALSDSIISYNSNIVTFNYNSISGATVSYTNLGSGVYTYTIQMNNFGSPRQTYHSYTDGNIIQQINSNIVSSNLQSGQLVLPYYTTTTSFSGTVAGYLGFDSAGNILTFAGPSLTGYVPYTGATQDVNLGEFGLTAGQLTLDTSPTGTATVATTIWNDSIGSSQTTLKGGSVLLKNGVDLVTRVVNKVFPNATLTRAAYQAVRVSGAQGQRLAVDYALADGDPNSADTLGLVCETIATNQEGFIITVGLLDGVNTTGSLQGETWNDGDVLYLSPTIPGGVTNIKPNASTGHIVIMGYVEYAHAINGKIYVKIMNGWELDELHNVYINTPLNNQGLFYSSSTQLWQNKSIDTALGYTPVNKAGDTMTGYLILNADPVNSLGAATKEYVDNLINGIDWKQAANAGTVASLPTYIVSGGGQVLTGFANGAIPSATTDGVTLVAGNRVLVKSETSTLTPNNGIYVVTQAGSGSQPFILTRSSDANTSALLSEATLSISGGFTLSNTQWHCNPAATPIVIGSTYITFTQIGSGVYFGTAPISVSGNTISISQSNISTDGYLSSTDWNTFNSKQNTITLTTTGSSGSATFISNTLNVPTYTLNGLGGASATTTLTINGDSYDLSANRTWSVGTVTSVAALTIGASGTDITSSVANSSTTPVITLNVPTASATNRGALSSADWSTFNNKQETITLTTTGTSGAATLVGSTLNIPQYQSVITNPVTGIGVTNELTFWTSSTSIGNLSTATYPSLTEISYVKGVTSDIQSQINSKQSTITLTTTGSSGSATFVSNTLNVPTYTLTGLGGVPTTRSLTINGTSYDLSADRTWSVGTVTSVAALTLGTSGTDLTSSVATGTTTCNNIECANSKCN